MTRIPTIALTVMLALPVTARAAPQVERLRGTIAAVEGATVTLRTADGREDRFTVAPDARISWVVPSSLDAIRDGVFIGTATRDEPPVALEVVLFPESMRGTGEGRYPWDAIADPTAGGARVRSTMTNGQVTADVRSTAPDIAPEAGPRVKSTMTNGTVTARGGGAERTLTVDYGKGQSIQILVPPGAPVVTFEPADRGAITAGAKAFVVVAREDGRATARRIAVGKDGLTPPM
ncbi:metal ABC transporter permease [Methylobacterium sp. NEAU 140]|uniref:metal ABC transporter permease n=1 Tax=Methylobacterium sp. NEAU 140 TaxID=3064945 RepID=UPI0027336D39|nr:metal ABC transporter permease [Methylobacterium sp. NEAU 140]MDP4021929.1 metal ABC transporter permease [Methylobacterium sp. NEAU 140]